MRAVVSGRVYKLSIDGIAGAWMMRRILLTGILLFAWPFAVEAQTRYIKDVISITFRTGPGGDHKVLENLESGQQVRLLKVENGWANIRLPEGETGWVLNQYLTADKPYRLQLDELKKEHAALAEKADKLDAENAALKTELEKIGVELETSRQAYEALEIAHKNLQTESTTENVISLREKNQALNLECDRLRQRAEKVRIELKELLGEYVTRFSVVGAIILFVGIVIGIYEKGKRRNKYL